MKYMGSKSRHAKEILPLILQDRTDETYVEPFAGGCNVIDKVDGPRIANDINYYLMEMFKAAVDGWEPPDIVSEDAYFKIKQNKDDFPAALVGFVGIGCSYGGKWFGGYARGAGRDYCGESKRNLMKQKDFLAGASFQSGNYADMNIVRGSIVYCDPPYADTTKYSASTDFNHQDFYDWCEFLVKDGCRVFVSEYSVPDHWECLWEKKVNSSLTQDTGSKTNIEKLFKVNKKD